MGAKNPGRFANMFDKIGTNMYECVAVFVCLGANK